MEQLDLFCFYWGMRQNCCDGSLDEAREERLDLAKDRWTRRERILKKGKIESDKTSLPQPGDTASSSGERETRIGSLLLLLEPCQ